MKRLQAFRFELRPNRAQRQKMQRFAGSCRFVYNKGLALQKACFDAGERKVGYAGLCQLLTQWRSETDTLWLKDAPTHRCNSRSDHDSFRYPDPKQIKLDRLNSRLFLPKLGWWLPLPSLIFAQLPCDRASVHNHGHEHFTCSLRSHPHLDRPRRLAAGACR